MNAFSRFVVGLVVFVGVLASSAQDQPLRIHWDKNFLTIKSDLLPGPVCINYIEAYCRPGSTDREWQQTVIPHHAELLSLSPDSRVILLRDTLDDGVIVTHTITATRDEVDFRLTAHNPTDKESQAQWAQPCIRVDEFSGHDPKDARLLVPPYVRQCFLLVDGKLTMLPTEPWANQARYTPGQVYCPAHVNRNDVNPRPLSSLVPSHGLCGCFSKDRKWTMAVAWEPYQEIFQGVITCIHNDFRIGGLKPGETRKVRGKIYLVRSDESALIKRFKKDFPEQNWKK